MLARDVMTTDVSVVGPNSSSAEVARILLATRVSALPVVDHDGAPIGVVSEWDLVGQHATDRVAKRERWLSHLAEGQPLAADFLQSVDPTNRTTAEIMHQPVIAVPETTPIAEVARLIAEHRIKRVFVTRGDRLVGVVSRIDLVRAHLLEATPVALHPRRVPVGEESSDVSTARSGPPPVPNPSTSAPTIASGPSAAEFDLLVAAAEQAEQMQRTAAERIASDARRALVTALQQKVLSHAAWQSLIERARHVAKRGGREFLLIRFPSELCSDRGRAINAADPKWPESLCGEAADVFERWQRELKPQGFGLTAQILDFPGGFPGDAGLTLRWGR
ncbi:CBS domain-containing protein [Rhodopseudomonas palustris]|uniref:CBS n=1 Tax=Rhodopseudomonas palustris (strain BisB18) TaxID=316056 RepID=Q21BL7_RHOPB